MVPANKEGFQHQGKRFLTHRKLFDEWVERVVAFVNGGGVPSMSVVGRTPGELRLEFAGDLFAVQHSTSPDGVGYLESYLLSDLPGKIKYFLRLTLLFDEHGNVGPPERPKSGSLVKEFEDVLYYLLATPRNTGVAEP